MNARNLFVCLVLVFFLTGSAQTAPNGAPQPGSEANYPAIFLLAEENLDATSGAVVEKKHRIIKLLSPAAVQRFSTLELPYESSSEKASIDEIKITDPDGKTRLVSTSDFKEYSPFQKYGDFGNFKVLAVQMKDIQPGSTLEYSTTKTDQPWMAGEYWNEVFLQEVEPIPIEKERVTLTEKEGKQALVKVLHATLPEPLVTHAAGTVTRTWELAKLEPFVEEFSMPSPVDVVPRLLISTISHWSQMVKGYQSQYFTPANSSGLDDTYKDIVKKAKTPEEKERAIYAFVSQTIRSLPPVVGDFGKMQHPLDYGTIIKQGYGDSRDKAALLAALLQKAGFSPQIAMVTTVGNGGLVKDFPVPFAFNRCVVKLDSGGKTVWLEPFTENSPFGYVSPENQGRTALLLQSGEFTETPVFPPESNLREVNAQVKINSAGDLEETLEVKALGADALGVRSALRGMGNQERQQVIASLATQVAGQPHIEAVTLNALDELDTPILLGLKFSAKGYAVTAGDLAFLTLPINVLNYLNTVLSQKGPRIYPFVLGNTVDEVKRLEITLPQGFKVRTLPAPVKIVDPFGSYQAGFTTSKNNKVIFTSKLILNQVTYTPKEFQSLKSLVAGKSKAEESKIVIEKVGSGAAAQKSTSTVGLHKTRAHD